MVRGKKWPASGAGATAMDAGAIRVRAGDRSKLSERTWSIAVAPAPLAGPFFVLTAEGLN